VNPVGGDCVHDTYCLGIFRERAHSPGREGDDAEILRLTGKQLEALGFHVALQSPEDLDVTLETPRGVFLMCERLEVLGRLSELEQRGVPHVNRPLAVLNTYRERMIGRFQEAGVPFMPSRLMATADAADSGPLPVWVKRADVHNTQEGDVVFADTAERVGEALQALGARGVARAIIQPHRPGDLVKFYGIGVGARADGALPWFRWFYHKDQHVAGHHFDAVKLARTVRRAATVLGLEIYGGDAIVTAPGDVVLLDLNAWPSFALYRDEAAPRIAAHLARRFRRGLR
jgi:hypothetical protein